MSGDTFAPLADTGTLAGPPEFDSETVWLNCRCLGEAQWLA